MTVKNLFKKLVPGVLAVALTVGVIAPSGLKLADVKDAFMATASAEGESQETSTRKLRFLGGALGDTITMKVIFHPDDEVSYVTLTNPNTGVKKKYTSTDWINYTGDSYETGDKYIEMPVWPKNMGVDMTFMMYDATNTALHFDGTKTLQAESEDYDSYTFTTNEYLGRLRDSAMSGGVVKDTDKDKAVYDLSRALLNYGEWSNFYFNQKNEPEDGAYVEYDPKTESPKYPSWWTSKTYWADFDMGEHASLNDMIIGENPPRVNYGAHDQLADQKLYHPYVVSLILEEGVKIRVYVSKNEPKPSMTVTGLSGLILKDISTSKTWPGTDMIIVSERCFETSTIPFGKLGTDLEFNSLGYWKDDMNPDKLTVSPIGYARLVTIDKASVMTDYEKSGLSNTLRAMVTVESAAGKYQSVVTS